MKLNIILPTYHRREKLLACLGSINDARKLIDDFNYTYVYYSDKVDLEKDYQGFMTYNWILPRLLEKEYKASRFWNDHFREQKADIYIYINDDIIFEINCLKRVVDLMNTHFPDLDGVVAITQDNIPENQACKTAFGAIGAKFIERFPDSKVMCEDYNSFYFDQELGEYAEKIEKLFYSRDKEVAPLLTHFHPAFFKDMMDETHTWNRKTLNKDKVTHNRRVQKKLLWGESFTLINEN